MQKSLLFTGIAVGFTALILALYALSALVMQWAWNLVIAGLFGAPQIEYGHAVGIVVLLSFIGSAVRSQVSTK